MDALELKRLRRDRDAPAGAAHERDVGRDTADHPAVADENNVRVAAVVREKIVEARSGCASAETASATQASEATAALRQEFPDARIIIISTFDTDEDVYRAFQAGACGYLLKSVLGEELNRAIHTVYGGQRYIPPEIARRLSEHTPDSDLTPRETEVLQFVVKGLSNKEIADLLGFTENTAKFHVKSILGKLQASDRTEAATAALQRGILHLG